MEYSSNDVKQLFRSVYTLVKHQDERKLTAEQILDADFTVSHRLLIGHCVQLMFEDFEIVGKKSREILWRKGYYDLIGTFKRQHRNSFNERLRSGIDHLLEEGISYFKVIIIRFAQIFNLENLKYLVDYELLEDYNNDLLRKESSCYPLLQPAMYVEPEQKELYTQQEIVYAVETIHALLTSLGDLHRYRIEFGLDSVENLRSRTRSYYMEAFKLNTKIGMAQNQLGMLTTGRNYNLDSVYHYLYSMCCSIPFECSESNVNHIFHRNIRSLESSGAARRDDMFETEGDDFAVKEFIAKFLLVVDIFFYDKSVSDFTSLCYSVLIDFKSVLGTRRLLDDEYYMTDEIIFQIVSILFFCMYRIKLNNSDKIYSLNAFMVALCWELLEYCTMAIDKFTVGNVREDRKFQDMYTAMYQKYDDQVRKSRAISKKGTIFSKDQKSSSGVEELGSQDSRNHSNKENDESDKKSQGSAKVTKRTKKHARRRRRFLSNESDSELSENYDDDEEEDDNDEGDEEDEDDEDNDYDSDFNLSSEQEADDLSSLSSFDPFDDFSDEERGHHASESQPMQKNRRHARNAVLNKNTLHQKNDEFGAAHDDAETTEGVLHERQLKFKKRYHKLNPNIILEFAEKERTMRSLKLLFDWLIANIDILVGCYQSNPEFVHNIMKLLNHFNIDILTNRYYFSREFVTVLNMRENLHLIFDVRRTIPLEEDVAMKRFPLFEQAQTSLVWEMPYKLKVTRTEECFLRIMKMVDFGFTVCKSKKFEYSFCPKAREFNLRGKKKPQQLTQKKQHYKTAKNYGERKKTERNITIMQNGTRYKQTGNHNEFNEMGKKKRLPRKLLGAGSNDGFMMDVEKKQKRNRNARTFGAVTSGRKLYDENLSDAEAEPQHPPTFIAKKSYVKSRTGNGMQPSSSDGGHAASNGVSDEQQPEKNINELMGQLWLRNEVKTLESKVLKRAANITLTPYLMVDSKCLAEYTSIIKNLIKTKKFVVLIPAAVLSDLDELKKYSEGARNAIKWLEIELSKGNRFLRTQKHHEVLPVPLMKIPKKMDREGSVFNQIVQFCNYIVTNHADKDCTDIITYLSGDSLADKKLANSSSYTGLLEAIPVKFEQIVNFYSSYKRK